MSDYQSTNVALLDCDGRTLSGSFLSSASAAPGLSAPLSGDVVLPGEPQLGDELALIDRFPSAIVTLVDVATGTVRSQLDVGTGFRANPQDLAAIDDAWWVTRYETNPNPGEQPFDGGGDLVIVDRAGGSVVDRIDLGPAVADAPGFWPRPSRMVHLGERLYVLAAAYDASFTSAATSRIVTVDVPSRTIVSTTLLSGLTGCSALSVEPPFLPSGASRSSRRLLVGCSGAFHGTSLPTLDESGLVLLEPSATGVSEVHRWGSSELGGRAAGVDLAMDERGHALVTTMGRLGEGTSVDVPDALIEVDLAAYGTRVVYETAQRPFELGGVRCTSLLDPALGDAGACRRDCFVSDGERGELVRLAWSQGKYVATDASTVEGGFGLSPRWLGRF